MPRLLKILDTPLPRSDVDTLTRAIVNDEVVAMDDGANDEAEGKIYDLDGSEGTNNIS